MHQQTDLFIYRFRYVLAGFIGLAVVVLFSAIVTAVGSGSILAQKNAVAAATADSTVPDSPVMVTVAAYQIGNGVKRVGLTVGAAGYGVCRSITNVSEHSGGYMVRGSAAALTGVGRGVAFVGRGIGSGIMLGVRGTSSAVVFAVSLPGKAMGSIGDTKPVANIIRPADDNPVPEIKTNLSPAMIAKITEQAQKDAHDQQKLDAQLAANRALDGSIVAGDPRHGGYPTAWDNARQDSMLDSWGMFNRECVSYTAWKVYQTYGNMPYWGGVGNANQWVRDARNAGIPTGSTPQVHSVAISMRGYYGHAMWVEKVEGDMIYVSQYNYDLHGHYSEMWVNSSYFTYIYFK